MPASSATTMTRTPATTPMPQIVPPPGTERSTSSTSWRQPASVDSSRKGTPGSSRRATRSRGSSWPRLSNSGAAFALAARVRASMRAPALDQRERVARGWRRTHRWRVSSASVRAGIGARLSRRAARAAWWRDGSRRTAGRRPPVPTSGQIRLAFGAAPSTRRQAPEMNAAAGESRKTIAAATSLSVPSRRSGTGLSCRAASPPSRADSGPCRSTRSSPARPR